MLLPSDQFSPTTVDFLSKITVTCFAASYLVALGCEISRLFFKVPVRWAVMFGFGVAGLFAHAVFLILQTNMNFDSPSPLSSWSAWCLLVAFCLVIAYLWITHQKPDAQTGVFILPLVLALIGIAQLMDQTSTFSESNAKTIWNTIHGSALLFATVVIFLGFGMGLMFILHSRRLKQKIKTPSRFKLPSLEWLQKSTERSLLVSTALMAFGVISGFVLNDINKKNESSVLPLSDPIIWSSLIMFCWLLIVTIASRFYKPARNGRKMAYLILSCFLFLVIELALVLTAGHGNQNSSGDEGEQSSHKIEFKEVDFANKFALGDLKSEVRS